MFYAAVAVVMLRGASTVSEREWITRSYLKTWLNLRHGLLVLARGDRGMCNVAENEHGGSIEIKDSFDVFSSETKQQVRQ